MGSTQKEMPLLAHVAELRRLLIFSIVALVAAAIGAFSFYEGVIDLLYRPLQALEQTGTGELLYINTIFEGFLTRVKISLFCGLVLSFPVHLFHAIRFVFPGLHRREKRIVLVALICSFVFIILSFLYSYYKIIPISVSFLTGEIFIPKRTGLLLSFSGNIYFILQFMFVALVVFQIPIILEILLIMNVVSRKSLWRIARYIIVAFFILAAIVTPPDFITQLSIALPLTGLYFLTLLVAKIFGFGKG